MLKPQLLLPFCLLAFLSACSEPPYPECQVNQAVFEGTVDGVEVRYELSVSGHSWINAGSNPNLKVMGENGEQVLEFSWSKTISHDQTVDAKGWLHNGTEKIGNCEDDGAVSSITSRGCFDCDVSGADFVLEGLYKDADCTKEKLDGTLYGCVRY